MIRLREFLADPEVFLCADVQGLRSHLRILFFSVFFATDGAGRFLADARELRAGLYAHTKQHVSDRDVQAWLVELHRGGFVKLYTENGCGYGKVTDRFWRQRDRGRKVVHPDESADPPDLFTRGLDEPPKPPPEKEWNRREIARRAAPALVSDELFIALAGACKITVAELTPRTEKNLCAALAEIRRASPTVTPEDIITRASAFHRVMPSGCRMTPHALAKHWAMLGSGGRAAAAAQIPPEPEAWRQYLKDNHEGESWAESAATYEWDKLPSHWREKILGAMKTRAAA